MKPSEFVKKYYISDPDSVDALHLLGVVAYQVGKYDVAVDLIAQAIEIDFWTSYIL